jgi:transposase
MLLPATPLTATELFTLEACSLHGPHPRQRRRALAILGHHRGQSLPQLATLFAVRYATVHDWLQAWQQDGIAGLAEGRRAGRPPKLRAAAPKK